MNEMKLAGSVRFSKTVQPVAYESETAEVTLCLHECDETNAVLNHARQLVFLHTGRGKDFQPVDQMPVFPPFKQELRVAQGTGDEAVGDGVDQSAPTVRERGKPCPKSGRTRRTKEEIAEDKAAEEAERMEAQQSDGIVITEQTDVEIVKEPLVEQAETPAGDKTPSTQELADFAGKLVNAGNVTGKDIMSLMKDRFNVTRLGLIEEKDRAEAMRLLKAAAGDEADDVLVV